MDLLHSQRILEGELRRLVALRLCLGQELRIQLLRLDRLALRFDVCQTTLQDPD